MSRSCNVLFLLFVLGSATGVPAPSAAADVEGPLSQEPVTPVRAAAPADPRIIALGQSLFDDPGLSGDGKRACSSCHDIQTNGADGERLDTTPSGGLVSYRTITVFNAALSYRLDWEGNAQTLEDAAAISLTDPQLMDSSFPRAVRVITGDPSLDRQFKAIYQRDPDRASLLDAIATFERSLVTPGSRFDLWLEGNDKALSPAEKEGYQLFKSFGCVSCHQGVNLGGNLFEPSGVFHPVGSSHGHLLRVPSLRNIAVMAPYFHDGSAPTLDKAVAEMGYAQLDRHLADDQVKAISAFLRTLTGRYMGKPLTPAP